MNTPNHEKIYLVEGMRTPFGKFGGSFQAIGEVTADFSRQDFYFDLSGGNDFFSKILASLENECLRFIPEDRELSILFGILRNVEFEVDASRTRDEIAVILHLCQLGLLVEGFGAKL